MIYINDLTIGSMLYYLPPFFKLDNFHVYANGPTRTLQVFSNSNKKFTHAPDAGECNQGFTISSTGSTIHVTKSSAGVKLHVVDSNGNKYYLRINTVQNNTVELVCQSHVDNVRHTKKIASNQITQCFVGLFVLSLQCLSLKLYFSHYRFQLVHTIDRSWSLTW